MFDSILNILVLAILVAGWGLLFYLVYTLLRPKRSDLKQEWTESRSDGGSDEGLEDLPPAPQPAETVLEFPLGTKQNNLPANVPAATLPAVVNDGVLLSIEVPKENETTPLAAELMFASLHGIYKAETDRLKSGPQDAVSFEMQAMEKSIRFFVWTPRYLQGYVEGQIYAQYQGVNIQEVKDYAAQGRVTEENQIAAAELVLQREDIFPIKSFDSFEVDPLSAITSTLSKLSEPSQIWVQVIVRPENDRWRNRAIKYIEDIRSGKTDFRSSLVKGLRSLASDVMNSALSGKPASTLGEAPKPTVQLAPGVEDALKQIETKSTKLGFQTKIRIVAIDRSYEAAKQRLDLVVGSFKQFNTTNLNGFVAAPMSGPNETIVGQFAARSFADVGPVLNVGEIASIYHLPSKTVSTPHIVWAGSKKGEPPANLPLADELPADQLTNMGVTNFRGSQEIFGIKIPDRRRHIYVIGKSGVGKSTLLQNMTLDDIKEGRGVGVVDPHGDYVDYVLERIPENRVEDVILFDPSDRDFPVGFNILDVANPKYKVITASGVVSVFKKIFGDSWGPRLEYWLSSAVLALLDYQGATLMMLPRLFTDDAFRTEVIEKIGDPVIKARWVNEYNTLDQRQRAETISPILNKVGQFLSSSLVRNIVAQSKGSFDLREVMDQKKILLVKLAKGLIGEDNAALLGAMIVTQLQLAAMSRADEADQEKRSDFFLYVDEFQNFATDSFAVILSEARKYRLSLTMAHQFIAQLPETVASAVRGNVGTIVTFRVGSDDATALVKDFAPVFDELDLVNLNIFNIYMKLSIDGLTADAFSAMTLAPTAEVTGFGQQVMAASRKKYAKPLADVQQLVDSQTAALTGQPTPIRPGQGGFGKPKQFGGGFNGGRPMSGPSRPIQQGGGRQGGFDGGNRQGGSDGANRPPQQQVRRQPDTGALKDILSGIQKKAPAPLAPDQQSELAKTLMDDLKGTGGGSFKDAFSKASEDKKVQEMQSKPEDSHPEEIKQDIKEFLDEQTGQG